MSRLEERRRFLKVIAGTAVVVGTACDGSAATSTSTSASATTGSGGSGGAGGSGPSCTMNPAGIKVGSPGDFVANGLYIVTGKGVLIGRDDGGLYALTAICTHS